MTAEQFQRGVFVGLMLAASVVVAVPILYADVALAMDSPGHLALVAVMQNLGEPGHLQAETFTWGTFPAPNSAFYLLAYALGEVTDLLAAERIILLLFVAGTPWAFWRFLVAFERSPWLAFLAFPLVYQWPLTEGFVDYCLSLPLVFIGLAAVKRYLAAPRPGRGVAVALLGVLAFLTHIQGFFYWVVGAFLLWILAALRRRREQSGSQWVGGLLRDGVVIMGASVSLGLLWFLARGQGLVSSSVAEPVLISMETKVFELFTRSMLVLTGSRDAWILVSFLGLLIAFRLLLGVFGVFSEGRERPDRWNERLEGYFPLLFLGVLSLGFAYAPLGVGLYFNMYSRVPAFLWFLLVPAVFPSGLHLPLGKWAVTITIPLLIMPFWASSRWLLAVDQLNRVTYGFWEVLKQAPEQSRLIYYPEIVANLDLGFDSYLVRHLAQYHYVINDGITSFSFANHPGRIVAQRELGFEYESALQEDLPDVVRSGDYDVLLQFGRSHLERWYPAYLTEIDRRGLWSLYEVTSAPPGDLLLPLNPPAER